jgi:NifU-like protein
MLTYSSKIKEHFINPRNVGVIADATVIGEVGSMASGQALKLYLKLDAGEVIREATFQVFGSPSAIAASSALTEMLKGKHIDEAARVTAEDISQFLGGLPPEKMHTCVMSMEALEAAYARYRGLELEIASDEEEELNICRCFSVPESKIERAIRDNNLTSIHEITHFTKAGGGCSSCHVDLQQILGRVRAELPENQPKKETHHAPRGDLTSLEKMKAIQEVLDREVRPGLAMDGGDMELVDVQGNKVYVQLHGHCNSCSSSTTTMKFFVEDRLREMVDPEIVVIDTTEHADELHAPPMR